QPRGRRRRGGGCPTSAGTHPRLVPGEGTPALGWSGSGRGAPGPGRTAKKKKRYSRHLSLRPWPGALTACLWFQIIQEIGALFPFFTAGYQGWKDSIRHNLSSNRCFSKLLKDPAKPKAKGNFWTVDVSQIPPDALKLQNTAISRQEAASFASDLAPFILHGWPYGCQGPQHQPQGTRAPSTNANSDNEESGYQLSEAASSISTLSSLSSDEKEPGSRRSKQVRDSRTPAKRPRLLAARESSSSSSDSDGSGGCTPAPSPTLVPEPCWEQLPTSYTKCVAPNVVAPPSGPPFFAFPSVPGLPYYSYRPPSYVSPVYWDLRPGPSVSPRQQGPQLPSLSVDLDHTVQGMPPNKRVYDVWVSHPGDIVHPALYSQGPVPGSMALTRYDSL
uniref:Fork-head domain-containing protein n=1 Tax=Chelonoidis abingdonii TaxID=106734 RepID=A0A8C0HF97_CHEAB